MLLLLLRSKAVIACSIQCAQLRTGSVYMYTFTRCVRNSCLQQPSSADCVKVNSTECLLHTAAVRILL
jgi:hypothetical protein